MKKNIKITDEVANEEPLEIQISRMKKQIFELQETSTALIDYIENMMGVELVRRCSNHELKFATIEEGTKK